MAWFSLAKMAIQAGSHIYKNRQQTKMLMSDAEKVHAEKMARGELEYKQAVLNYNKQGCKDELVLIIVVLPIVVLSWSVFSGDPEAKQKLDLFFEYFNNFPEFYKWLVLGIFGSIYGLKPGMDMFKKRK